MVFHQKGSTMNLVEQQQWEDTQRQGWGDFLAFMADPRNFPYPVTNAVPLDGWVTTTDGLQLPDADEEELSDEEAHIRAKIDYTPIKRAKAIALLLTGMTVTKVAGEIGVNRRTVHEWISRNAEFKAELNKAKREAIGAGINVLQAATRELAVSLISLSRTAVDDSDRIRAITASLKMVQEWTVNEDIVSRLDRLELSRNAAPTNGATYTRIKGGNQ